MKVLLLIFSMNVQGEFTQKVVAVTNTEAECQSLVQKSNGGQKLVNKFYKCLEVKQ